MLMLETKSYEIFASMCVMTGILIGFIVLFCYARKVHVRDERAQRAFLAQTS